MDTMEGDSHHSNDRNSPLFPKSTPTTTLTMGDRALKGVANLLKLLPTGTVFLFQFLNPLLTNTGHCHPINKYLTGALLAACGFSCAFSSFTDSYVGSDSKTYYGVVTKSGVWAPSDRNSGSEDLSKYRLRIGDFAHAGLSLVVFAVISLLDDNTVKCFYPSFEKEGKTLLEVLPTVVGVMATVVFAVFPSNRHGIGYPASSPSEAGDSKKDGKNHENI